MDVIGDLYAFGYGVERNAAEAVSWYRKAAEAGSRDGMFDLARACERGEGLARDYAEAGKWYRAAADRGHATAMNNLGTFYEGGLGVTRDYAEAMKWYRKAAEGGNTVAMDSIGDMLRFGRGVAVDLAGAVEWYRRSAEGGYGVGMSDLGWMYMEGQGVARDYAQTMNWCRKAAEAGDSAGMNSVGWLYQHGWGVTVDNAEALKWYRKAAEAGNGAGMSNVGWFYQEGLSVTVDNAEALGWFRKGAAAGNGGAMLSIGRFYEKGIAVAADRAEAIAWYRKAAATGQQVAKDNLKRLGVPETDTPASTPSGLFSVIPLYPGATLDSGGGCAASDATCHAVVSATVSKAEVFAFYTSRLAQAGWKQDVADHAPAESGNLGKKELWGLLNFNRSKLTLTVLILSDRQTKGKATVLDINLINRGTMDELAGFLQRIPTVQSAKVRMGERFESGGWAVRILSAKNEGSSITKQVPGMPQPYVFKNDNLRTALVRVTLELERLDGKAINQGMLAKVQVKDSAGDVYWDVGAGMSSAAYYDVRKGGNQKIIVPVQAKAEIEYVFAVPIGRVLTEFIWEDRLAIGIETH
jgi:TPR repeat protein